MSQGAPRFSQLAVADLTEGQRPVAKRLMKNTRGNLGGPFSVMLRSPGMMVGMVELFEHYRFNTKLDPRLKEFAILILAREWSAQFEWFAHKPAAERAGLAAETIEELRLGKRPTALLADEAIVYDFVIALIREHAVSDRVFEATTGLLGEEQLVDLLMLVGAYMKVALILNVGRIGVPAGNELPLPPLGRA